MSLKQRSAQSCYSLEHVPHLRVFGNNEAAPEFFSDLRHETRRRAVHHAVVTWSNDSYGQRWKEFSPHTQQGDKRRGKDWPGSEPSEASRLQMMQHFVEGTACKTQLPPLHAISIWANSSERILDSNKFPHLDSTVVGV